MKANHDSVSVNRKMAVIFLVIFWSVILPVTGTAQDLATSEKIKALKLPILSGDVNVYYSEGFAERAAYLQEMAEAASGYFQKPEILGVKLDLALVVLGPEDWAKVAGIPYGVSHILSDAPTAILPASEDNVMAKGFLEKKEDLSEKIHKRLSAIGFSYDEAAPAFVDLIGFHEMGHIYAHAYGIDTWPSEKWLCEFVATYLAYAFMKENRPKLAILWDVMNDAIFECNEHEYTTLADFERMYIGVGLENYGWYQGKFQQKVAEIYEKMEMSFVHALKKSLFENPEALKNDPYRLHELDTISKGFVKWAQGADGTLK